MPRLFRQHQNGISRGDEAEERSQAKSIMKDSLYDSRSVSTRRSFLGTVSSSWSKQIAFGRPRAPLLSLAKLQKFGEIIDILEDNRYNFKTWLRDCSNQRSGQTALHLVLDHRPPLRVVNLLLMRMRQVDHGSIPETVQDKQGRTPLHVAVARACDIRIIERFLRVNFNSPQDNLATVVDRDKRYPLHWACANPFSLHKAMVSTLATDSCIENMVRIISCLVVACPAAADSEDESGWTPKDMAKAHKADKRILRLLELAGELRRKQIEDSGYKEGKYGNKEAKYDNKEEKFGSVSNTSATQAFTDASSIEHVPIEMIKSDCFEDHNDMSSLASWDGDFKPRFQRSAKTNMGGKLDEHGIKLNAIPQDHLHQNNAEVIKNCWFL
jgi:hypothetical protein